MSFSFSEQIAELESLLAMQKSKLEVILVNLKADPAVSLFEHGHKSLVSQAQTISKKIKSAKIIYDENNIDEYRVDGLFEAIKQLIHHLTRDIGHLEKAITEKKDENFREQMTCSVWDSIVDAVGQMFLSSSSYTPRCAPVDEFVSFNNPVLARVQEVRKLFKIQNDALQDLRTPTIEYKLVPMYTSLNEYATNINNAISATERMQNQPRALRNLDRIAAKITILAKGVENLFERYNDRVEIVHKPYLQRRASTTQSRFFSK